MITKVVLYYGCIFKAMRSQYQRGTLKLNGFTDELNALKVEGRGPCRRLLI